MAQEDATKASLKKTGQDAKFNEAEFRRLSDSPISTMKFSFSDSFDLSHIIMLIILIIILIGSVVSSVVAFRRASLAMALVSRHRAQAAGTFASLDEGVRYYTKEVSNTSVKETLEEVIPSCPSRQYGYLFSLFWINLRCSFQFGTCCKYLLACIPSNAK